MFRSLTRASLLLPFLIAGLLPACGEDVETPATQMAAADKAMRARDFAAALKGYEGLIAWKGEGKVAAQDQFKASLESVKCLISLKRPQEGVDRFAGMFGQNDELAAADAHKHTLAVLRTLVEQKTKADISIEFLGLAQEKHPEKKDQFGQLVDKIKAQGLSSEQLEKLKKLGYF